MLSVQLKDCDGGSLSGAPGRGGGGEIPSRSSGICRTYQEGVIVWRSTIIIMRRVIPYFRPSPLAC